MPRAAQRADPQPLRAAQLAIGGAVLLVALAVLMYGTPRFGAALASLEMRQTADALLDDRKVEPDKLRTVLAYIGTLSLTQEPPAHRASAGYVLMQAALAERSNPLRYRAHLGRAETALKAALRQRPADSYSWARLAFVALELGRPRQEVLAAWRLSIATAPFEPQLLVWRLGIGMSLYPQMSVADRATLAQQTLNAWDASRWRTVRLLAYSGRPDLLRPQLQSRPAKEREEFERSYVWFVLERDKKTPRTGAAPSAPPRAPQP